MPLGYYDSINNNNSNNNISNKDNLWRVNIYRCCRVRIKDLTGLQIFIFALGDKNVSI